MIYQGPDGKGILENLGGAAFIGVCLIFSALLRRWYNRWGATEAELRRALPGDDLVPGARLGYTNAVTVRACPEHVWPWIAQWGQGRGGLYSYERLENIARCDIHNADRVLPEHQKPQVGDKIRLGPEGYPFFLVADVQPGRALVLGAPDMQTGQLLDPAAPLPESYDRGSITFFVEPAGENATRLIVRGTTDWGPKSSRAKWLMWRVFTEPIAFVMMRRAVLGIKQRAEALAADEKAAA